MKRDVNMSRVRGVAICKPSACNSVLMMPSINLPLNEKLILFITQGINSLKPICLGVQNLRNGL